MCEIIVKIEDHTNPDSDKDRRGSYKRNYVIKVVDDNHKWNVMERKQAWIARATSKGLSEKQATETWHNRTALVMIPDMTVAEVLPLSEEQTENDEGVEPSESTDNVSNPIFRRRRWYIDLAAIPPDRLNPWLENGEIVTNRAEFVGYVFRIRDNEPWQP